MGFIKNPIVVNEKMEIIDGQGRFEVCKEKGLPIYYNIVNIHEYGYDQLDNRNLRQFLR